MCQKIPFDDKSAAKVFAVQVKFQQRHRSKICSNAKTGRKLYPYECGKCGKWHLTTMKRKLARVMQ